MAIEEKFVNNEDTRQSNVDPLGDTRQSNVNPIKKN